MVTIYNFQEHRNIQAPGWRLGWTWAKHEVLWSTVGGQAINQGNCSHFKGNIPVSCMKTPTIVDLKPNTPYNQQIENCCRGGLLSAWSNKHRTSYISAFQVSVGQSGTSNRTVKLPKNFTFKAPRDRYTCGPAKVVRPTKFLTMDKRRTTQALSKFHTLVSSVLTTFIACLTCLSYVHSSKAVGKLLVVGPKNMFII